MSESVAEILTWARKNAAARLAAEQRRCRVRTTLPPAGATSADSERLGRSILHLCRSGDAFDMHDIAEAAKREYTYEDVRAAMVQFISAGLAQMKVHGGRWRPADGGPTICRPTLWVGTPRARRMRA